MRASRRLFAVSGLALVIAAAASGAASNPRTARIEPGQVSGVVADGVASFKGIPYAAPPKGALRWRPPQPVASWTGLRAANAYGRDCMQEPFPTDAAPLRTTPDEDCLYLNVWAPESKTAAALPVMVWIHGGGFVNGGSSPAVYDGARFARQDVVLVSFNHRLGRFGFFAHPALSKDAPEGLLGNYGFLDQIAVLHWVKRNIAAFGGDPGNVTIFGESAGGASVNTLMISPLAAGLFHKAIVQSGGGRTNRAAPPKRLRDAEAIGLAFARRAGVSGDDAAALAALRTLPAAMLVGGMNLATPQPETYSGPIVDGRIVPAEIETLFRGAHQARVPYLVGANALEFGMVPLPPTIVDAMFEAFGADREKALAAYDPEGKGDKPRLGALLMSDQGMVEPARLLARLTSAAGQATWAYRFSYVATSLRDKAIGALHATEIPFVFATVRAKYAAATSREDEAVGDVMNAYWTAFARTGDPNGQGRPRWPSYSTDPDVILDFVAGPPVARPDPAKARLDLVERLAGSARP
jgi:para-nitrobenzyl esterase